jgi:Na+/proline symporter
VYKGRGQTSADSFLLADKQMPWPVVLLGIMATQASAITFLSAPGQAYTDGMRFVQYYFGLPIAMVVICVTFIPIFRKLSVYTAYEYLEQRFDRKTRLLTATLFLFSRGLSTGISIYAPSIILSTILGWNIYLTNVITGGLLIIYTYTGGAKAIAHTQKLQFLIILCAMAYAGYRVVAGLPEGVGLTDALYIAGKAGKLNVITTQFNWKDKYNLFSGLIGGFFLALSYFGTDHSQVGRYLTAKDTAAARQGLLLNGLVKIPMQFLILLLGALLFAFFSFRQAPLHFNEGSYQVLRKNQPAHAAALETTYNALSAEYRRQVQAIVANKNANREGNAVAQVQLTHTQNRLEALRDTVRHRIARTGADGNDTNYIFLYFVKNTLPIGLVGLLFAVIFLASWGSISAALNAQAASSVLDIYLLATRRRLAPRAQLALCRWHTLGWGVFSIGVAMFATRMGSLIEAVNVLGSLFYGTILGIFLVAFYMKRVSGNAVFIAACLAEGVVVSVYFLDVVSFLWLNVVGAAVVVGVAKISSLAERR